MGLSRQNQRLFEKALEMTGLDSSLISNHGYINNMCIDDVDNYLKHEAYLLMARFWNGKEVPLIFFFEEETKVETLTEIQSEIRALPMHYDPQDVADLIQEKIDGLKGEDNK